MLVNVKWRFTSKVLKERFNGLTNPVRKATGIYLGRTFNPESYTDEITNRPQNYPAPDATLEEKLKWYNSEWVYGVADDIPQILKHHKNVVDSEEPWALFCVELRGKHQPKDGGWRWHKWGTYIGTREPQCEYLYDEPDIDKILVYSFKRVFKGRTA